MRLLDGFLPVFQHLNGLAEHLAESRYDSCEALKDHYKSLLARLDDAEFTEQYSEQQRGLAKFAVVILIDEKVAATDWGMLHKWSLEPLQKLLFETLNGDMKPKFRPGIDCFTVKFIIAFWDTLMPLQRTSMSSINNKS